MYVTESNTNRNNITGRWVVRLSGAAARTGNARK